MPRKFEYAFIVGNAHNDPYRIPKDDALSFWVDKWIQSGYEVSEVGPLSQKDNKNNRFSNPYGDDSASLYAVMIRVTETP